MGVNINIKTPNLYDFTDKKENVNKYIKYMLNRTNKMFKYEGLPENVNARQLELQLQQNGYIVWFRVEQDEIVQMENCRELKAGVVALYGGIGGVVDFANDFTYAIIAHPRLKQSKMLKIGEDCVVMRNDAGMLGLLPMFERYATELVENDITMNLAMIQSRAMSVISASDDRTRASAEKFIKDIQDGKMGVIGDNSVLETLKILPYINNANNMLTNLIENKQYIKASWFNELGLSSNYNMKRESINSGEAQMGKDALLPLKDDMYHQRLNAIKEINEMFNLNITLDFDSGWHNIQEEVGEIVDEDIVSNRDESVSISNDLEDIELNENKEEVEDNILEEEKPVDLYEARGDEYGNTQNT